ncbi:MAG: DotU family type IV/VI secretion system protein [Spirochaetaceae bacterium]|jgi:type VI protein secretion system component VasF|nr:DotU family type IV/VI secretion system protein [Spirochaetaceae bacterium]
MEKISALEKLCNPLLLAICNYWQLACIDSPIEAEKFRENIVSLLENARREAMQDEKLSAEFALIEKPVVFFIDYMVREGRFSFRDDWHIIARNYNELSGDEKFFDLLEETLDTPDSKNSVTLFFIMLGLGFDGIHRRNPPYIRHCMQVCAKRVHTDFDIITQPILETPPLKKKTAGKRQRFDIKLAMISSAGFFVLCLIINIITFTVNTSDYRKIISKAVEDAIVKQPSEYPPLPAPLKKTDPDADISDEDDFSWGIPEHISDTINIMPDNNSPAPLPPPDPDAYTLEPENSAAQTSVDTSADANSDANSGDTSE